MSHPAFEHAIEVVDRLDRFGFSEFSYRKREAIGALVRASNQLADEQKRLRRLGVLIGAAGVICLEMIAIGVAGRMWGWL